MFGLVGKKEGMTRVFTAEGKSLPVTVIVAEPNRVTQIKTPEKDGYSAVQVTTGTRRRTRVNKAVGGHFAKAKVDPGRGLWEFRVDAKACEHLKAGDEIGVNYFETGEIVDVQGKSKGKGFAGAVKRWNFKTQDATHGNSLSHRAPGSIGQCQTPGRVFKGKKMAGHMGAEFVTVQNQEIVKIDLENNLILVRGAIPGAPGDDVIILPSVKKGNAKKELTVLGAEEPVAEEATAEAGPAEEAPTTEEAKSEDKPAEEGDK